MEHEQHIKKVKHDDEKLSWADIQYYSLTKIFNSRHVGDTESYRSGVTALSMILAGHKDDSYRRDLKLIETKREVISNEDGDVTANIYYYDAKLEALSELLYRINRGVQRVRQRLQNSNYAKEISYKLTQGTGQNIFITGAPGSGKSYTAIAQALEITGHTGQKFGMKHLVFSPQEFLKVYNNEKLTPPGSVIIFDEAGVTFNSKDHAAQHNKLFSKLLQTIRHRAVCVIFTAPDLSYLDASGRKLLHWWNETAYINKKDGICTIKPFTIRIDQREGKILFPYPVYEGNQLTKIDIELIPKRHREAYEKKARAYKNTLALSTQISYGMMDNSEIERLRSFIKLRNKGKTIKAACEALGINKNTGTRLERMRHSTLSSHLS